MNKPGTLSSIAVALALGGSVGCARQNPRTISHIDTDASLQSHLPWQPQDGRVITTWVDPRNSTMSTLYGNDTAVDSARSSGNAPAYPSGAMIALVTWKQREDERWFGANIPASVQSVEFVTIKKGPTRNTEYLYQRFEGGVLLQAADGATLAPQGRAAYLLSQRAAMMP
jgi:hypothetical protein